MNIKLAIEPAFDKAIGSKFNPGGIIADRAKANLENWLLTAPKSNPAMLQMFRDQNEDHIVISYHGQANLLGNT